MIEAHDRRVNIKQRLVEAIFRFHLDDLAGAVPLNVYLCRHNAKVGTTTIVVRLAWRTYSPVLRQVELRSVVVPWRDGRRPSFEFARPRPIGD